MVHSGVALGTFRAYQTSMSHWAASVHTRRWPSMSHWAASVHTRLVCPIGHLPAVSQERLLSTYIPLYPCTHPPPPSHPSPLRTHTYIHEHTHTHTHIHTPTHPRACTRAYTQEKGWSTYEQGAILSSFFLGYVSIPIYTRPLSTRDLHTPLF